MHRDGRPSQSFRALEAVLRKFIGEHQCRGSDLDLRMSDAAAWLRQTEQLLCSKSSGIEVNRLRCRIHMQIRIHLMYLDDGTRCRIAHILGSFPLAAV